MKRFIFTLIFLFILINICFAIKGSQYKIAKKYARENEAPIVFFSTNGEALGFILYEDIDGDNKEDMIIPYKKRIPEKEIEEKASVYKQYLIIKVLKSNGKIINNFIKIGLSYVRTPKPYITVKKVFKHELPKVFVMINDGFSKKKGPDTLYKLVYNGLDKNDKKRKDKEFETIKMSWRFIFYKFSNKTPTITEFFTKTKENRGVFYIRTIDKNAKWPKIPMKKINKFVKNLQKYKRQIFWEYGPLTEWYD